MYPLQQFSSLPFLLQTFDFSLHLESQLLDVILPFLLKFIELLIVLESSVLEILGFQLQLRLQLLNFPPIKLLNACKLVLEAIVFNSQILILMKKVIDFEITFGEKDFFATILILNSDEFILELYPFLTLVIQIYLKAILCLPELLSFVFQHKLDFAYTSAMLV
jgi:hypothetical protein